jgi:GTP cyclohydrolase I
MHTIHDILKFLSDFAPPALAASWDNVGLLVGDGSREAKRVMTCLTVTPESVAEAVRERANVIVSHHPFPFKAEKRWTTDTHEGRLLLSLVEAKIAVISPHTAFDSAALGINQRLAEKLDLQQIAPLIVDQSDPKIGTGRIGKTKSKTTIAELCQRAATSLKIASPLQFVGEPERPVVHIAIACGSAGELLEIAEVAGCDCFVTGEARFHTALAAQAAGLSMILLGHYASERFAVEELAERIATACTDSQVWASVDESDPLETWTAGE